MELAGNGRSRRAGRQMGEHARTIRQRFRTAPRQPEASDQTGLGLAILEASADGVVANALMPGGIATPLQRHLPADYAAHALEAFRAAGTDFKTVEQGAATSALLAGSPLVEGVGGRYFENCNEAARVDRRGKPGQGGVAPYALDPGNAERLWELSLKLIQ